MGLWAFSLFIIWCYFLQSDGQELVEITSFEGISKGGYQNWLTIINQSIIISLIS